MSLIEELKDKIEKIEDYCRREKDYISSYEQDLRPLKTDLRLTKDKKKDLEKIANDYGMSMDLVRFLNRKDEVLAKHIKETKKEIDTMEKNINNINEGISSYQTEIKQIRVILDKEKNEGATCMHKRETGDCPFEQIDDTQY